MAKKFDVIIIGASIAGMAAAKFLANTDLKVLVIERAKDIGLKTCAHGVTRSDLNYINEKYFNFPISHVFVHFRGKSILVGRKGVISSINRTKYLQDQFEILKKAHNITFLLETSAISIEKNQVITDNGTYDFKYLIGADGSASVVRKHLNLPAEKIGMGLEYFISKKYDNFELFMDDKLFGSGYAWIFPNKGFTSVGCGSDTSVMKPSKLRTNFEKWLKTNNIDVSGGRFEGAIMNCDYRGYRFGNIFLIGDAAGLIGPVSGKGMFAACASAEQATNEILGIDKEHNHIESYLHKRHKEEVIFPFLADGFLRRLMLRFIFRFPYFKPIRQRLAKAL